LEGAKGSRPLPSFPTFLREREPHAGTPKDSAF